MNQELSVRFRNQINLLEDVFKSGRKLRQTDELHMIATFREAEFLLPSDEIEDIDSITINANSKYSATFNSKYYSFNFNLKDDAWIFVCKSTNKVEIIYRKHIIWIVINRKK